MGKCVYISSWTYFIFAFYFTLVGCYTETPLEEIHSPYATDLILTFDKINGMVDSIEHTIMFTIGDDSINSFSPEINFYGYNSLQIDEKVVKQGEVNELGKIVVNHSYQIYAKANGEIDTYQLIFTTLPLIHVKTLETIPDASKVLSRIELQYYKNWADECSVQTFDSYAGIEIRGRSSTTYDKKSFGFELWEDESASDYYASLLGMRYGEDWILDAMYIDQLRMRNKISFELWQRISHTPVEDHRNDVIPGIECKYVELFINNRYQGLYSLNEKIDETRLQYSRNQFELGGVLYKAIDWAEGSTSFDTYDSNPPKSFLWDGWEQIFPKHEYFWNPLSSLRTLIVRSNDENFTDSIVSIIDMENALNYYLFVNLLSAADNVGKNIFLTRYTHQSRFFFIPWDIEGSWGRMWDGKDSPVWGITFNNLFSRLIDTNAGGFNDLVHLRWNEYRETFFHQDSLLLLIQKHYLQLKNSGVIERENARWDDVQIDLDGEYAYIVEWLNSRLEYLDKHFD